MKKGFFIVNSDGSGVVGKKNWENQSDAEKHAETVLKQSPSVNGFFICEAVSVVQRRSPPVEIIHLGVADGERNPVQQAAE